jgi:hypothetical protein
VEPLPPLDAERLRRTATVGPWRTVPFWLVVLVVALALLAGVVLGVLWR